MYDIKKKTNMFIIVVLVLAVVLLFSGCVCPLFSIFEKSTGLKIRAGENIDTGSIADDLIYPGSKALVQVNGDIEKVMDLVNKYGVSFSDDEKQALEQLPESITGQEIGAIAYSTADSRTEVLSYYEHLTGRGWQIESFSGPGSGGIQESNIVTAVKGERKQALMVTGTEKNAFIIFIDFDWAVFESEK